MEKIFVDSIERAKLKDDVLQLIIDKKHGVNDYLLFNHDSIECSDLSSLKKVLEEMDNFHMDVIKLTIGQTHHVRETSYTKGFLNSGGFSQIRKDILLKRIEDLQQESNDKIIHGIEKLKTINEAKIAERNAKYYWTPHWISGISVIVAIGSLIWSIYNTSINVSQEQYDSEMESIQKKLKQIKTEFKQENDSLKNEINEANLLIEAYKADSTNA